MSSSKEEDVKEQETCGGNTETQMGGRKVVEEEKDSDTTEENNTRSMMHEEEVIKKKYGGLLPRKPPLISKDHERAFFDSADWALGKQGAQKPKGPLESLRPKLEPTPHHPMRRSAYAPADEGEGDDHNKNTSSEDQTFLLEGESNSDGKDDGSNRINNTASRN